VRAAPVNKTRWRAELWYCVPIYSDVPCRVTRRESIWYNMCICINITETYIILYTIPKLLFIYLLSCIVSYYIIWYTLYTVISVPKSETIIDEHEAIIRLKYNVNIFSAHNINNSNPFANAHITVLYRLLGIFMINVVFADWVE
jgi:hypothetical protein